MVSFIVILLYSLLLLVGRSYFPFGIIFLFTSTSWMIEHGWLSDNLLSVQVLVLLLGLFRELILGALNKKIFFYVLILLSVIMVSSFVSKTSIFVTLLSIKDWLPSLLILFLQSKGSMAKKGSLLYAAVIFAPLKIIFWDK